jgi:hypothetical protein
MLRRASASSAVTSWIWNSTPRVVSNLMVIDSFISHEVRVRRKARERNVVMSFERFMEERLYVGVKKVN